MRGNIMALDTIFAIVLAALSVGTLGGFAIGVYMGASGEDD